MSAPGRWLRSSAQLICRPRTLERLIDPMISDLQIEYAAALGSWRRRAVVLLSAYAGFWKALALHCVLSSGDPVEPRGDAMLRRAIGFSCLGFVLVTVLLTLPPLVDGIPLGSGRSRPVMLILTLLPQALPISLPVGVCIGIMNAMRTSALTRQHLVVTLTIAFAATCLVLAVMEWGLPWGNQAFRQMVIAELTDGRIVHVEPGLNELGFSGLARRTDVPAVRHYHLMWALGFAPIPLAVFSLAVGAHVRRAAVRAGLILAAVFAYYAVLWVSDSSIRHGAPMLLAWAPNLLFVVVGVVLLGGRRGSYDEARITGDQEFKRKIL